MGYHPMCQDRAILLASQLEHLLSQINIGMRQDGSTSHSIRKPEQPRAMGFKILFLSTKSWKNGSGRLKLYRSCKKMTWKTIVRKSSSKKLLLSLSLSAFYRTLRTSNVSNCKDRSCICFCAGNMRKGTSLSHFKEHAFFTIFHICANLHVWSRHGMLQCGHLLFISQFK